MEALAGPSPHLSLRVWWLKAVHSRRGGCGGRGFVFSLKVWLKGPAPRLLSAWIRILREDFGEGPWERERERRGTRAARAAKHRTCSWCRAGGAGWCVWWRGRWRRAAALPGRSGTRWSQSRDCRGGPSKYPGSWTESRMGSAWSRRPRPLPLRPCPATSRTVAGRTPSRRKCCWRPRARSTASGTAPLHWTAPLQPHLLPAQHPRTTVSKMSQRRSAVAIFNHKVAFQASFISKKISTLAAHKRIDENNNKVSAAWLHHAGFYEWCKSLKRSDATQEAGSGSVSSDLELWKLTFFSQLQ